MGRLVGIARGRLMAAGILCSATGFAAAPAPGAAPQVFEETIRPLTKQYCFECHSSAKHKGEIDLERFTSFGEIERHPDVLAKVVDELRNEEMPPDEARVQPSAAELERLQGWAQTTLDAIARQHEGDPGPVMLRRLSNAEYTYTLRDLTGVDSLDPAREFPADGAAGEGFTNTGQALVMSPPLLMKYLDAAKGIASHAVLLPDGLRFSAKATRLDWTNEIKAQIRACYSQFAELPPDRLNFAGFASQATFVATPEENGRLPLARYFAATLEERASLRTGAKTIREAAEARGLSPRYLGLLWEVLNRQEKSPLFDGLRAHWQAAGPGDTARLVTEVAAWQHEMWRWHKLGYLDNDGRPRQWMEPVTPLAEAKELRLKLEAPASGHDISVWLEANAAGDASVGNLLEWRQPRILRPGRPAILLRDVPGYVRDLTARRKRIFAATTRYLAAVAEIGAAPGEADLAAVARRHRLEPDVLQVWLDYLGVGARAQPALELFSQPIKHITGWDFITGWGTAETTGLIANPTNDQRVQVPGVMWPHTILVNPSDTEYAAVAWRSPVKAAVRIDAGVVHVPTGPVGKGVNWSVERRHGRFRERLAAGFTRQTREPVEYEVPGVTVGPLPPVAVEPGDLIVLLIGAREGESDDDHSVIKLHLATVGSSAEEWSLAPEVSPQVLAGNPHADGRGRPGVWSFCHEPVGGTGGLPVIPADSLPARWLAASPQDQGRLAKALQRLLTSAKPPPEGSDAAVRRYLTALAGPFFADVPARAAPGSPDLIVPAPAAREFRLAADLFGGCELVATARILPPRGQAAGTAQARMGLTRSREVAAVEPGGVILAAPESPTWARLARQSAEFNRLFPAALCYTEFTPTDEVMTLELYHRDDGPFVDLMLDDAQKARLDRLWDELHVVSQDAVAIVAACEDAVQSEKDNKKGQQPHWPARAWGRRMAREAAAATSLDFGRILQAVRRQAGEFQSRLAAAEPRQLDAVLDFAGRAYRRPLSAAETAQLHGSYDRLRRLGLAHPEALRLTLARVLISPTFLYRAETPPPGAAPAPVGAMELATRLSYFLWSSAPDAGLRAAAAAGKLSDTQELRAQVRRMTADPRVRRLALEFGCEWLRLHDFDQLNEKSARAFPTFAGLRGAMYEETIRFLTDLFQNDRPALNLLDADYTFLNETLAKHYGIPGVSGPEWRRVEGIKAYGRGGLLAQSTFLAKESAASRTSPILRGSWIVEVILGNKLPSPPPNVPQLPADESLEKLSVRELTERHTSDPRCAGCHAKFNAYGYALENFDGIGRWRERDLGDRPIVTRAKVGDGTELAGFGDLRDYLAKQKRPEFLRQFCKKLLGYALGRGIIPSDDILLKQMQAEMAANKDRVGAAIEVIVLSRQFREIRGREFAAN